MNVTVVRANVRTASLTPQVSITIAIDTAYVAAQANNGSISQGVFMMDNRVRNGSTGEGTLQLSTVCNAGDLIGFHTVPVNGAGALGDQVVLISFADIEGNVFTAPGHPVQQPPLGNDPAGTFWVGQALRAGTEKYMIQTKVTVGQLQPVSFYVWWEAFITAS